MSSGGRTDVLNQAVAFLLETIVGLFALARLLRVFLQLVRETLVDLDVSPLDVEATVGQLDRLRPALVVPPAED